jgi:hypothetical protein
VITRVFPFFGGTEPHVGTLLLKPLCHPHFWGQFFCLVGFLLSIAWAIQGLLCYYTDFWINFSIAMKNGTRILLRISLNL